MDCAARLDEVLDVLHGCWDVIDGRVWAPEPPSWAVTRGWHGFLLGLDDDALTDAEVRGLAAMDIHGVPESLRALMARVERLVAPLRAPAGPLRGPTETYRVPARKRPQVAAAVSLARTLRPTRRVVDLGAGHGHLSRALARSLEVPVLGVERDGARVRTARALARGTVRFEQADAAAGIPLRDDDLLVGLHACGGLGEAIVRRAGEAGAPVLLLSCCLQKVPGDARPPLSELGQRRGFHPSRVALGLTNIAHVEDAREAARVMRGRCTRHALRRLLESRGVLESPGDEAVGISAKALRRGLAAVADTASARRGLPPPTSAEIAHFETLAVQEHGVMRRLSLPRNALGRVVEYAIVLDRATHLEERGYRMGVEPLVSLSETPRNLVLLGDRAS